MTAARSGWPAQILHFWFERLEPAQWFGRSDALDAALQRRFGRWLDALGRQPPAQFLRDPLTARAAVLLFDQVPRNIHRANARAFATDRLAGAICKGALAKRWDRGLSLHQRQFLLMPLMHSEAIADQRRSIQRFTALGNAYITTFARAHARMVARFGRFPHRNAALGRKSSPAELRAIADGKKW